MKSLKTIAMALLIAAGAANLHGCATAAGAALGGVAGHAIGGSTAATLGGAAIGGVIGHEVDEDNRYR